MVERGLPRESKAQTQAILPFGVKWLKQMLSDRRGNARPRVVHADHDGIAVSIRAYPHAAAIRHRLQRVGDQVQEFAFYTRAFQQKLDGGRSACR